MTAIATRPLPGLPPALEPSLAASVSRRFNALMGSRVLPADLAVSAPQRLLLKARLATLDGYLAPGAEKPILIALAGMLGILPGKTPSSDDAATQRRAYLAAVADLPGFAVIKACEAARIVGIGDRRFAPSPPELREAAVALAHPYRVERSRIVAVLDAKIAAERSPPDRRRELAAAARRAFRIPDPTPTVENDASGPATAELSDLGELGREILRRSKFNRLFEPVETVADVYPADRFDDEAAA